MLLLNMKVLFCILIPVGHAEDFVGSGDNDGSGELFPYSSDTPSVTEIINIETVSVMDTMSDTGLLLPMTSSAVSSLPAVTSPVQG